MYRHSGAEAEDVLPDPEKGPDGAGIRRNRAFPRISAGNGKVRTMKVTCEYCDSFIEADGRTVCPMCGAPLGEAVRAAEEKAAREAAELEAKEAKISAELAEQEKQREVLSIIKSLAGGTFGSMVASGVGAAIGSSLFGGSSRRGISRAVSNLAGRGINRALGNPHGKKRR